MSRIDLWPGDVPASAGDDEFRPYIEFYPAAVEEPVGAVIVFPGGGYSHRAAHEGQPVAEFFNSKGIHAFVVQYRTAPHKHPAPLLDAARAVRMVRNNAEEWNIRANKIAVCGFSAGGHLAASIGVLYDEAVTVEDDLQAVSARPDGLILCYPVISSGEFGHVGSFDNLVGKGNLVLRKKMSLETRVTSETPPTFLWHTADDAGVPVENSFLFSQALRRCDVPFELHVFPHGRHGLGLALENSDVAAWPELCATWLQQMNWK
ncbi:MAG: alpha/beta hydrolase [Victivallaceae bacterium]|nr:alpha/beta hydrolase [Victivallaceae bacterium]